MTFLPIVERELRVRARQRSTYRFRVGGALVAIAIVAFMLVVGTVVVSPDKFGAIIFKAMAWMAFVYCLLEGARNTADCLSEEKRAGTLGLLFLTDLKGYDVVLGKLMATSLNSFYGLLAIFPPLALPILLGGVTAGEFWRLVLVLLNTLFFSLTTGLLVSAASRNERKAWAATLGIILFFAVLPPLFRWLPFLRTALIGMASPSTTFFSLHDAAYAVNPGRYWQTLGSVHALSWLFLISASIILPKAWQDQPMRHQGSAIRRLAVPRETVGGRSRRRLLEINPVLWLAEIGAGQQIYLWMVIVPACIVATSVWLIKPGSTPIGLGLLLGAWVLHFVLAIWMAWQACYLFSGARDSGVLELLAATPLAANEIIAGHLLALRRLFARPVVILIGMELLLLGANTYLFAVRGVEPFRFILLAIGVGLMIFSFVLDLHAVARFGTWMGLTSKRPSQALTKTVLYVLMLPHLPALCCGVLWPVMVILKDLIFINYAQDQLRRQFRTIVTERFASSADTGAWPIEPQKSYPQLPSVIDR